MAKRATKKANTGLVERDRLIALLGMAPEDRSTPENWYAATNTELRKWAIEDGRMTVDE